MVKRYERRSKVVHMLLNGKTVCNASDRYLMSQLCTTKQYSQTSCISCNKNYARKVKENE